MLLWVFHKQDINKLDFYTAMVFMS